MSNLSANIATLLSAARTEIHMLPDALPHLLEIARRVFGSDGSGIIVFNPIAGNELGYIATDGLDLLIAAAQVEVALRGKTIWIANTAHDMTYGDLSRLGRSVAVLPVGMTRYDHALALVFLTYDDTPDLDDDTALSTDVFALYAAGLLNRMWTRERQEKLLRFSQDLYQSVGTHQQLFDQMHKAIGSVLDIGDRWSMTLRNGSTVEYSADHGQIHHAEGNVHELIESVFRPPHQHNRLIRDLSIERAHLVAAGVLSAEHAPHSEYRSWLLSPLRLGNECIGVLTVQHHHADHFDEDDLALLELLGNHIEVALRSLEQAHEAHNQARITSERTRESLDYIRVIDTSINQEDDPKVSLNSVLEAVGFMIPLVSESAVLLHDTTQDLLEVYVAEGPNKNERAAKKYGRGARSRVRTLFDDPDPTHAYQNHVDVTMLDNYDPVSSDTRYELDVKIGDLGILNLEGSHHPFNNEDVAKARLLAEQALVALQRREERERRTRLTELQRGIADLVDKDEADTVGDRLFVQILRDALSLTRADYGSLFLLDVSEHDPNLRRLVRYAESTDRDAVELRESTINLYNGDKFGIVGHQVMAWIQKLKARDDIEPLRVDDLSQEPWNSLRRKRYSNSQSEMVVPLYRKQIVGEKETSILIGVMNFESRYVAFFKPFDAEVGEEFAQMAVVVLDKASAIYYKKMTEALHEIDRAILENARTEDPSERALVVALEQAKALFKATTAELYIFEEKRRRRTIYNPDWEPRVPGVQYFPEDQYEFPGPQNSPIVNYLLSQKDIREFRLFTTETDKRFLGESLWDETKSAIAIQITLSETISGVVYLAANVEHQFRTEDLINLERFARQIEIAYQLYDQVGKLSRERSRLTTLRETAQKLTRAQTEDEAFQYVLDAVWAVLTHKRAANPSDKVNFAAAVRAFRALGREMGRLEPKGPTLIITSGGDVQVDTQPIEIGTGVTGKVFAEEIERVKDPERRREQITVRNESVDSNRYRSEIADRRGPNSPVKSILSVAVVGFEHQAPRPYGTLTVAAGQYYYFSSADERFVQALAMLLLDSLRRIHATEKYSVVLLGKLAREFTHQVGKRGSLTEIKIADLNDAISRMPQPAPVEVQEAIDKLQIKIDTLNEVLDLIQEISSFHAYEAEMFDSLSLPMLRNVSFQSIDKEFGEVRDRTGIVVNIEGGESDTGEIARIQTKVFLQALNHLVQNSVDELELRGQGGRIDITITPEPTGKYIILQIMDDGPGIREDKMSKIFDWGVTTKKKGTGYGLWMTREYLDWQGARIEAFNRPKPEHGAIFTITLPTAQGE